MTAYYVVQLLLHGRIVEVRALKGDPR